MTRQSFVSHRAIAMIGSEHPSAAGLAFAGAFRLFKKRTIASRSEGGSVSNVRVTLGGIAFMAADRGIQRG